MNGAWAELLLLSLMIGGPALVAIAWEAIDDRRVDAAIRRQLAEQQRAGGAS